MMAVRLAGPTDQKSQTAKRSPLVGNDRRGEVPKVQGLVDVEKTFHVTMVGLVTEASLAYGHPAYGRTAHALV